ncbi:MAG TPA: hypothetical protein VHT91_06840 [Kofleriaceae bacterium]|jgi:hypothetical protein|nr:hypothetical protein [Kofleriaceae bacterium]
MTTAGMGRGCVIDLAVVRAIPLALLLLAAVAGAAPPETVVVVSDDPGFAQAADEAFRAAGAIAVRAGELAVPAIADLTGASRQLADGEHATAAVILVFGEDGATLIAYDRGVDRALMRVLPYRAPLGPRESAEAAHMARTMLRALRVTPELDLPLPHPQEAVAIRAQTAAAQLAAPTAVSDGRDPGVLAVGLGGGLRAGAPGAAAGASGTVQLIWRPDALGVAVTASLGRAAAVDAAAFTGMASDAAGALTARLAIRPAPRWSLAGEAGAALHRVHVTGALSGAPVDVARLDPAIRIGGSALFIASPRLAAGVAVWADGLLVRQDYQVANQRILGVPVAQITLDVTVVARVL